MSDNLLCIGIARSGNEAVFSDTAPNLKMTTMQCFSCGVHGQGGVFKQLQTKDGKKNICPLCVGVMDIEYLDRNSKKVKKNAADGATANVGGQEENAASDWNADLAWLPELSQRNINLLVLLYHVTNWMYSKASGDKSKTMETASMREFLDILDQRYMNVFRKRIDVLKKREDERMAKIPDAQKKSAKAPQPLYNMDALAKVLKSMPMSEYEQRARILSGLRIIPRDLSHIDAAFVESHVPVSAVANIYAKHHDEVKGLIPMAPAQRAAGGGIRGQM